MNWLSGYNYRQRVYPNPDSATKVDGIVGEVRLTLADGITEIETLIRDEDNGCFWVSAPEPFIYIYYNKEVK